MFDFYVDWQLLNDTHNRSILVGDREGNKILMHIILFRGTSYNLTHWGRTTHIWVSKLGHQWSRWWFCLAPTHYLNQCSLLPFLTVKNKFQWNFNQNKTNCMQDENVVRKMAVILYRSQYVKSRSNIKYTWDPKCAQSFRDFLFQEDSFHACYQKNYKCLHSWIMTNGKCMLLGNRDANSGCWSPVLFW